jgi:hypothetical protein
MREKEVVAGLQEAVDFEDRKLDERFDVVAAQTGLRSGSLDVSLALRALEQMIFSAKKEEAYLSKMVKTGTADALGSVGANKATKAWVNARDYLRSLEDLYALAQAKA